MTNPKRGRPSDYSFQVAISICARLAEGKSLRAICSEAGMPGRATVFRWIARHKEFRDEYTLACELRAEDLADEMIEIVDDPCVWVEKIRADGRAVMVLDHENIARVHLRMKARAAGRADGAEKIRQPALKGIRAQPRVGISCTKPSELPLGGCRQRGPAFRARGRREWNRKQPM